MSLGVIWVVLMRVPSERDDCRGRLKERSTNSGAVSKKVAVSKDSTSSASSTKIVCFLSVLSDSSIRCKFSCILETFFALNVLF